MVQLTRDLAFEFVGVVLVSALARAHHIDNLPRHTVGTFPLASGLLWYSTKQFALCH
jgi:hypothetical protein